MLHRLHATHPAESRETVAATVRRLLARAGEQRRFLADEIAAARVAVDAYHAECRRNGR